MKHFKIIGPETTREFDIEDNEMIEWFVWKIKDYEEGSRVLQLPLQNQKTYNTLSNKGSGGNKDV